MKHFCPLGALAILTLTAATMLAAGGFAAAQTPVHPSRSSGKAAVHHHHATRTGTRKNVVAGRVLNMPSSMHARRVHVDAAHGAAKAALPQAHPPALHLMGGPDRHRTLKGVGGGPAPLSH